FESDAFTVFFQAEDGIRDRNVTGVQTCALPIYGLRLRTLLSFSNFELNLLALFERAVAVHLDCAPVNEHVLVFAFEGDESVALFSVEPLDGTLCHYFSIQCSAIEIPHLSRDQ